MSDICVIIEKDKKEIHRGMHKPSLVLFSEKNTKLTLFIFFSLLILSVTFFVFAEENTGSDKNIFQDSDQDGLSNDEEKQYGTNPSVKDTDGDGYSDGVEVTSGYDPLKPAPGDKIIKDPAREQSVSAEDDSDNLTEKVSSEIVNILKSKDASGEDISLEDVNASVEKLVSGSVEEIVLPEIDTKDIQIKKLPKNLKEKDRLEQERADALEYLTVLAYLMANNSPNTFQTEDALGGMLTDLSGNSISALLSGNMEYVDQLAARGEKIVEELKNVAVPEQMLDVHIKALQMALYAIEIKSKLKSSQNDPLGQIAVLSQLQGLLGSVTGFMDEVHQKLVGYGIEEIPLNL